MLSAIHDDGTGGAGGGIFGHMGGLQAMGIVNALKTGDMWLDMLIAMLIPVLIRLAIGLFGRMDALFDVSALMKWWRQRGHKHQRFLVHRMQRHSWGSTNLDSDTRNTVLIKAIQLYLHHKGNLKLTTAVLNLTSMEDKATGGYHSYSDDDDDEEGGSSKTMVGTLSKYKIIKKPPSNEWHALGMFGSPRALVELWVSEDEESTGKEGEGKAHCTTTFHFVSAGATAIDDFIDTAYRWYLDELRKMENNSRHLYELKALGGGGGSGMNSDEGEGSSGQVSYSRYKLSDEKTFDSLFFRQKDSLLNIMNHFQNKSGKYAIAGYPHKLGLLLHGPPGTGKTSLIKALAQYTGRSIVSVPLSRITTNSELMEIFFEKRYHVHGEDVPVKLGFKDVIFVMEDVDAASKVVRRRDDKRSGISGGARLASAEMMDLPAPKSTWKMLLESNSSDCRELVTLLMEKSDRLREAAFESDVLESLARKMGTIPGLSLIGEGSGENETLAQVERDAIDSANSTIDALSSVDRFIGSYAQTIKNMLEAEVKVNDAFVDELLGLSPDEGESPWKTLARSPLKPRTISYSNYDDATEEALFGSDVDNRMVAATLPANTGSDADSGKKEKKSKDSIGPSLFKPIKDMLNLTGLLNVLDGVVDTPGRILIMTTNHPEMLDPALIRPGRIDKKILLGYMCVVDIVRMLEHYFQTKLGPDQTERIQDLVDGGLQLTPAQVEQMTSESDEVEEMIVVLEERMQLRSTPPTAATSPSSTVA